MVALSRLGAVVTTAITVGKVSTSRVFGSYGLQRFSYYVVVVVFSLFLLFTSSGNEREKENKEEIKMMMKPDLKRKGFNFISFYTLYFYTLKGKKKKAFLISIHNYYYIVLFFFFFYYLFVLLLGRPLVMERTFRGVGTGPFKARQLLQRICTTGL